MKAGDESAAHASVIAREAEVRGGELLKAMQLKHEGLKRDAGPGRGKKTVEQKEPTVSPLKSLGLTPTESKRMQAAASVPKEVREKVFDAAIKAKKALGRPERFHAFG